MRNVQSKTTSLDICQYFFECVACFITRFQYCTKCRDIGKQKDAHDYYYINLVEITQERTVVCSNCMYHLLKKYVHGTEEFLREELRLVRLKQSNGVLVDPFLISCGL